MRSVLLMASLAASLSIGLVSSSPAYPTFPSTISSSSPSSESKSLIFQKRASTPNGYGAAGSTSLMVTSVRPAFLNGPQRQAADPSSNYNLLARSTSANSNATTTDVATTGTTIVDAHPEEYTQGEDDVEEQDYDMPYSDAEEMTKASGSLDKQCNQLLSPGPVIVVLSPEDIARMGSSPSSSSEQSDCSTAYCQEKQDPFMMTIPPPRLRMESRPRRIMILRITNPGLDMIHMDPTHLPDPDAPFAYSSSPIYTRPVKKNGGGKKEKKEKKGSGRDRHERAKGKKHAQHHQDGEKQVGKRNVVPRDVHSRVMQDGYVVSKQHETN